MDKQRLEKGELAFLWLMLLTSLIIGYFSFQLFAKNTSLSSEGAFPMMVAGIMLIMSVLSLLEVRKNSLGFEKGTSLAAMAVEQVRWLLPGSTALIILYVLIYAIVLKRVGFAISTYLFLVVSAVTLLPKKIVRTLIVCGIIVGVIILIFQILFKVRLP